MMGTRLWGVGTLESSYSEDLYEKNNKGSMHGFSKPSMAIIFILNVALTSYKQRPDYT